MSWRKAAQPKGPKQRVKVKNLPAKAKTLTENEAKKVKGGTVAGDWIGDGIHVNQGNIGMSKIKHK